MKARELIEAVANGANPCAVVEEAGYRVGSQPDVRYTHLTNIDGRKGKVVLLFDKDRKLIGWNHLTDKVSYGPEKDRVQDSATVMLKL
jgi:hypothetical protein